VLKNDVKGRYLAAFFVHHCKGML